MEMYNSYSKTMKMNGPPSPTNIVFQQTMQALLNLLELAQVQCSITQE